MFETYQHFSDLPEDIQRALRDYISLNCHPRKTMNKAQTAYGLKQHFTSTAKQHITSLCFAEAMKAAGFQVEPIEKDNWIFNIRTVTVLKP